MRLFTHRIEDLDFLKTISVVVNVGGGTTSILHNVSLAVCCKTETVLCVICEVTSLQRN